ncbi:hypothetical protein TCDM_10262 [Trypanosoma cruzi Dm28c]|uniref:Uncharacterized protein n=1 Tax=Trypanosoma cruzi Dm28c TaxID=1416333 RepID=V5D3S3_TRYCR|nr:hypothetical protein TCDM_10262 [Trypanosoma cruzi Dm28c]
MLTRPSPYEKKTRKAKEKENTAAGCGCVCVALRVSARPDRKENKTRGKKCVLRPTGPRRTPTRHGSLVARPHVTAPSARRSSRPSSCVQQARRTGPSS